MSAFNPQILSDFARYYGFHYDICKPEVLVKDFRLDMERGLRGGSSSLAMIPAYLSPVMGIKSGQKVIALDAGGTNLRAALVRFDEAGKAISENTQKAPMPGTKGRVNKNEFFDQIAQLAAPLLEAQKNIAGIGFCFSYPMEVTKDGDGILLSFSKEVDAPGVVGQAIGAGLREALARRGVNYSGEIVLLNDTASTLLCGLVSISPVYGTESEDKFGVAGAPVIGYILGTGLNMAYPEINIPKIGFNSTAKPQIVVTESGGFTFRYRGRLDVEYDMTTKFPNAYQSEKAVAGAYIGPLSFHIFKQAVRDGVLNFNKKEEFLSWPALETKDLNSFLRCPLSKEGKIAGLFSENELDVISSFVYIASIITRRGALLAAAQLAGAVKHISERLDGQIKPFAPIRIACEGTTFILYKGMREALQSYLYELIGDEKPVPFCIEPVESASLYGAAVAALCR